MYRQLAKMKREPTLGSGTDWLTPTTKVVQSGRISPAAAAASLSGGVCLQDCSVPVQGLHSSELLPDDGGEVDVHRGASLLG
mmetsp:Transcript_52989/g.113165  ORF Transcript_52989/g.113165 Transcript_52989/m.113165 type:complete len:82 (+) Transcript_52989:189-434(+)